MTKILWISEGYILQLIKHPTSLDEYTEIYEESAWAITQSKTAEEFLNNLCNPEYVKNQSYFTEKNKVLFKPTNSFLRADFEILNE